MKGNQLLLCFSGDLFKVNIAYSNLRHAVTSRIICIKEGGQAAFHLMRINDRANNEAKRCVAFDWYQAILRSVEGTLNTAINGSGSIVL